MHLITMEDWQTAGRMTREWLLHNPFNLPAHAASGKQIAEVAVGKRKITDVDTSSVMYAASWHLPILAAHMAARAGLVAHAPFSYWNSARVVAYSLEGTKAGRLGAAGAAGYAYYAVGKEVVTLPTKQVAATATDLRGPYGQYRNPITGM